MGYAARMNWNETQTRLREHIRRKRGAQAEIARRLGITSPSVANYVTAGKDIPIDHLDTILDVLGLTLNLVDAAGVNVPDYLLAMSEHPDQQFFDSDEQGRHVYHYGETEIAGVTDLVWYSPALWWVKLRHPRFSAQSLGTLEHTGSTILADAYRVTDGPFQGFRVAVSANLIHLFAPGLPGTDETPLPYPT